MNYYYDLVLNFSDNNIPFYEWEESDSYDYFKKIPLFQVRSNTLKDFVNYDIVVDTNFLDILKDKAKVNGEDIQYVAVFADKNGGIAIQFNEKGKSIARSFLNIIDEININEILYTIDLTEVNYKKEEKVSFFQNLRHEEKVKLVIKTELKDLMKKKDYIKLKYLYMEWFNKKMDDYDAMYNEMVDTLNKNFSYKELKIYDLIRLSLKKV